MDMMESLDARDEDKYNCNPFGYFIKCLVGRIEFDKFDRKIKVSKYSTTRLLDCSSTRHIIINIYN